MMRTLGRIHITLSNTLAVAILAIAILVCFATSAAFADEPSPLKIVSAQGGAWRSAIYLEALPGARVAVDTSIPSPACLAVPIHLVPNGSAYFRNFAEMTCGSAQYELFDMPVLANSFTVLSFDDGRTSNSFTVPPIGAVSTGAPSDIHGIVNDDQEGTYINAFGSGILDIDVYDGGDLLVSQEIVTVTPPVTQYRLKGKVSSGRLVVRIYQSNIGVGGAPAEEPIYGFVSVATPKNANARIIPFGSSAE